MSPTRRATTKRSGGREPVAARARIQRSALYRWWRTVPMSFSAAGWRTTPPAKSPWQRWYCPVSAQACCAWQTAASSDLRCGSRRPLREADLLWRVRKNIHLPCEKRLPDGSYLSRIYPSQQDQRRGRNGIVVRVIEYRLEGVEGAEPLYRLATTILDHELAPAAELAALYHERWEIETAFDELKTHLRGAHIVLRSKTPDLVRQEFYGLLMAHFAVRGLMHEAALSADEDPDRLSFLHAVRAVRRKMAAFGAIPPSGTEKVP